MCERCINFWEGLHQRVRWVCVVRWMYCVSQSVYGSPGEVFMQEYFAAFFVTALTPWLGRFWPWSCAGQAISVTFSFFHWVLFSITLCLWDAHVHHFPEKVLAPASKRWRKATHCLHQTLAFFFFRTSCQWFTHYISHAEHLQHLHSLDNAVLKCSQEFDCHRREAKVWMHFILFLLSVVTESSTLRHEEVCFLA